MPAAVITQEPVLASVRVARPPAPAVLWALAIAACAGAACSAAFTLASDHVSVPPVQASLMAWVTLSYVLAGLVAWWRRPGSRFGALMVAAGAASFLSSVSSANAALPYTVGIAFDLLPAVAFLHVYLAFPSGHLERPFERVLIAVGYVTAFALQLVAMTFGGFGPDNLLELTSEPDVTKQIARVQLTALSVSCLAGIALLAIRRRDAPHPLPRRRTLLVDAFGLALVMLAVLFLSAVLGLVSGQPAFETLRRATLLVIGLAPIAFLVGLLHARLARSAVGDLVLALRAHPAPVELRDALARALRDPSLRLVYWLPEFESWADVQGRPVELAALQAGRATTFVEHEDARIAALLHDPALEDEPELLEGVAAAAGIALENAQLHAELRARLDELKGSRARLVQAGDAERRRIERDLHDGAQQRMVAVALQLRLVRDRIRHDPDVAEELVASAGDEVARSLAELRELARGIHPAVLEHGLDAALAALATRATVPVDVAYDAGGRLPEPVEFAMYFVASEALANVAKYARATSVHIRVDRRGPLAVIEIADDGIGGADDGRGSGLRGLADRVEALDGRLRVASPPGAGTVVTAEFPCAS